MVSPRRQSVRPRVKITVGPRTIDGVPPIVGYLEVISGPSIFLLSRTREEGEGFIHVSDPLKA